MTEKILTLELKQLEHDQTITKGGGKKVRYKHTWEVVDSRYECNICGIRKTIPWEDKSNFDKHGIWYG